MCRVDVALQCPSRPKDHAGLTIWTTVWICFHVKALYVSGKSTLVVQNFLTDSTDPELHPSGFDLGGRLAFNIFQYFLLLNKHWNKAGYKGDNYGMWMIQWSNIINACLYQQKTRNYVWFLKSLFGTCLKLIIGPSEHQVAQVHGLFWQDLTVPPPV